MTWIETSSQRKCQCSQSVTENWHNSGLGHQILTFGNSEWQQEEKSLRQMGSTSYGNVDQQQLIMEMDLGPKFNFGDLTVAKAHNGKMTRIETSSQRKCQCSQSATENWHNSGLGHQILTFSNSEWQQEEIFRGRWVQAIMTISTRIYFFFRPNRLQKAPKRLRRHQD